MGFVTRVLGGLLGGNEQPQQQQQRSLIAAPTPAPSAPVLPQVQTPEAPVVPQLNASTINPKAPSLAPASDVNTASTNAGAESLSSGAGTAEQANAAQQLDIDTRRRASRRPVSLLAIQPNPTKNTLTGL